MFIFLGLLIIDAVIITVSYIFAYILKFKIVMTSFLTLEYGNFYNQADIEPYLESIYLIIIIWLLSMFFLKVYQPSRGVLGGIDQFLKVLKAGIFATGIIMASTFIIRFIPGSRYVLVYALIINVVSISFVHHIVFLLQDLLRHNKRVPVIIVGTDETSQSLYERLLRDKKHQYIVVGALGPEPSKLIYSVEKVFKRLGDYDQIWKLIEENRIKEVFIVTPQLTRRQLSGLLDEMIERGLEIWMIPSFYDLVSNRIEASNEIGLPMFSIKQNGLSDIQSASKRFLDIGLTLILLILSSPVMLIVTILLWLEHKGEIIYKQERIGLNGKPFVMYKFRTMPQDIEKHTGPVIHTEKMEHRLTPLGSFLRKTSFDELPQFINILRGDMSLVGPRPERPYFVDLFQKQIPDYDKRHKVLPGLAGWAQVNGRSALSTRVDEKLMYDLYYINNWSLSFDIKIILKTAIEVIRWRGAY